VIGGREESQATEGEAVDVFGAEEDDSIKLEERSFVVPRYFN